MCWSLQYNTSSLEFRVSADALEHDVCYCVYICVYPVCWAMEEVGAACVSTQENQW